jgi:hypothetical protein
MTSITQNKDNFYYLKIGYQYFLFHIFLWFHRVYRIFYKKKENTYIDPVNNYFDKEKVRFLKTYNYESEKMNTNVSGEFYNSDLYKETILNVNSDFEKKWKASILYENTPRGNVIMYYDIYKKGFAYYSDQSSMPYSILNTAAMKYVRVFSCRDLFIDDKVTPSDNPSPLIALQDLDEKSEKKKINTKSENNVPDRDFLKKAPFAKLKKYKMEITNKEKPQEKEVKLVINNLNKFIYMGKLLNFSFIQKIPKKKVNFNIKNSMFDGLFDKEHNLQTEVISYKDFKNSIKI